MAEDQWLLREDGYLNVDTDSTNIIYHPNLNVILVFTKSDEVKVLDVNSGVILQSCSLADHDRKVRGKYLSEQDRILFWNGKSIGLRADYNGVLLLDTILQTPIIQTEDNIKLELLLSEAGLFLQSINNLEEHGIENTTDVTNEFTAKIAEAQKNTKKGIKAQKWNTICVELPHSSLKMVANSMVIQLKRLDRHIPALAIASAINERLTELQIGARIIDTITSGSAQRFHMFSEAVRRQTFEQWPHMDYKWALPDQMAQAGFYHQPSVTGDDRAMCFTCNVCLVSWEKTDEPWSEHERHSPSCPFVKGEYTQNVPLAITYATSPATKTDGFDVMSNGDQGNIICTGKKNGEVMIWNTERVLKPFLSFQIILIEKMLLKTSSTTNFNHEPILTALCTFRNPDVKIANSKSNKSSPQKSKMVGTKIVCGVTVQSKTVKNNNETSNILVDEMNSQNEAFNIQHGIKVSPEKTIERQLLLVIYELLDKTQELPIHKSVLKSSLDYEIVDSLDNVSDNNKSSLTNICSIQRFNDNFDPLDIEEFNDLAMFETNLSNDIDFALTDFNELIKTEDEAELIKSDMLAGEILQNETQKLKSTISEIDLSSKKMITNIKIDELDAASNNVILNIANNLNNKKQMPAHNASHNICSHPIQYVNIITSNSYEISDIIPSSDKKMLLVVLKLIKSKSQSMDVDNIQSSKNKEIHKNMVHLILYKVQDNGLLNPIPVCLRALVESETPIEICMLPKFDNNGRKLGGQEPNSGVFVMTCLDGSLKMVALSTLKTISEASIEGEKFVSATYCKSLERLCGCTESGSLHFYSFYDMDADSGDERDDDNLCFMTMEGNQIDTDVVYMEGGEKINYNLPSTSTSTTKIKNHDSYGNPTAAPSPIIALKSELNLNDLQMLYSLTLFDEMLTPYAAEVPGCWSELVQAQKQRRHPQHIRPGDDTHLTKTWRLHNDATTWDEHIIELTLSKPCNLGHVDFKFSLYQQCPNPPTIQVTLLKQNSNGLGYRMKPPNINNKSPLSSSSVDENVDFNIGSTDTKGMFENPVLSEEYLLAHNAEILAGPFELSSCMDLCDQGGQVVLTSPKLFKAKGRNFLLHIKTMADPSKDGQVKTRGCDWLHEISITLRGTKNFYNVLANERIQRCAMLESNILLTNLLKLTTTTDNNMKQNLTLDILLWIISIRMARFRYPKIEFRKGKNALSYNDQQVECIKTIEDCLTNLILSCIVFGDRTTAHKCVKIIMTTSDGAQNLPTDKKKLINFEKSLEQAILKSLPSITMSKYSGAVRWLMLLISGVSTIDTQGSVAESCLSLLLKIVSEMEKRLNPYSSLLKTRYGLYGTPFEPELFDVELPLPSKLNSLPITIASVVKSANSPQQTQTIDLKHFCVSEGTEHRILPFQFRQRGIGNHLKGLLEVEPLHYVCLSASEATKIENMDAQSTSSSGNVIEDIIFEAPFENIDATTNGTTNNATTTTSLPPSGNKKSMDDKNKQSNIIQDDFMNNVKNILVDKIFYSAFKNIKMKGIKDVSKNEGLSNYIDSPGNDVDVQMWMEKSGCSKPYEITNVDDENYVLPWHKLLSLPQKQMIVIDRMHSGARRFVTLDFGYQILLTDLIIPACEDLVSLFIDIWSFEEEEDIIRLVAAPDIGVKTLVLSDLQPPPICRYLKITVTGRYGMSATRCKIPLGSFFGHPIILEEDSYADPFLKYLKIKPTNIPIQLKVLHSLFEDVNCRYSLSNSKLSEMLEPVLKSELSNVAHMQAYLNRNKECDDNNLDYSKLLNTYEECTTFQLQLNIIRNVITRMERSINCQNKTKEFEEPLESLASLNLDKLRVLSECLIEALLHFIIDYGIKNVISLHSFFDPRTCSTLFNTLVVFGDAHIQLATCSLLVRMCCFQPWWGDFLTNIFTTYYSSQNSKIFPQDRVFFLLTYLGRKSIAMGSCRVIVIDSVLKTLAKLLSPLSPRYRPQTENTENQFNSGVSSGTDLQLISWLLLFLSVCVDDGLGKKTQSFSRWDFMSGEADMSKARTQLNSNNGRNFSRSFRKRLFQTKQYNTSNLTEKLYLMQAELALKQQELNHNHNQLKKNAQSVKMHPTIYDTNKQQTKSSSTGLTGTTQTTTSSSATTSTSTSKCPSTEFPNDNENPFDKGLRSLNGFNALVVVRGLVGLLLGMDFTCNMDLFLLTCKVIARLVSACQPSIQLSKIMTTSQLQQLIRIAVWKDQQQPWAVHAITCLLQDILEADKNYKQSGVFNSNSSTESMDINQNNDQDDFSPTNSSSVFSVPLLTDNIVSSGSSTSTVSKDISYADAVKFNQLPSLMECDDTEMEDILDDILERGRNLIKKANNLTNRNGLTLSYRSVSCAKDSRLEYGLESNIEVSLRRLTMLSSLNLFASLPQIPLHQTMNTTPELTPWPENILQAWSNPEYNQGMTTNLMLMMVFDNIFSDFHLQDSWLNLEQVLQLWLTLNGELSEKSSSISGFNPGEIPKIPFGPHAVHGLLSALSWHSGIKLRAWCLGFQCLTLACNPHFSFELYSGDSMEDFNENYSRRMGVFMVNNPNFEKMLLRFFSGCDMNPVNFDINRYAGPTICKLIHELFIWLEIKSDVTDMCYVKKKLKEILLRVVLNLVQPGGSISNQQGPIDAQSQLIKELISFQYEKTDLGLAMSIIESVSYLIYNNISNIDRVFCQTSTETSNSNNVFGSLFATVLGSETSKQSKTVSDNTLLVSLLRLSSVLVQTALPRRSDEPMSTNDTVNLDGISPESQTDEIKAEQQHNENRVKIPCVADTVLLHSPTMTRLLGSLSHCSSSSFAMLVASSMYASNTSETNNNLNEPQTVADAVFHLLMLLSKKATQPILVVKPLFDFLNSSSSVRFALPKLQLSEPFLWYILKVLEIPSTVSIFTELGGVNVLCQSLVRSNQTIINMQPNLVSMIMQHMTKSAKSSNSGASSSAGNNTKKPSSSASLNGDELTNFAPFCTITSANPTAQPADVLIQAPIASHRRARSPAWTYLFYPYESHVDLTITLPSAVLLREIHLQPHLSTLATCPSAVAIEVTKDINLGSVPICKPMSTVGMTCIKLKFAQPEIATSVVIRLYRPRDSSNIGLTQISVLGSTTFADSHSLPSTSKSATVGEFLNEDESATKSSLGWLRILAQCFSVATYNSNNDLACKVIQSAADTAGFLEACCSLLNVTHSYPNITLQNLETVLLKLGLHNKELGLKLIDNLLKNSIPQTFKLCNEPVSDLLYDLCTTEDNFTRNRIKSMVNWVKNLHLIKTDSITLQYATNPYNGFVKCLASVLWTAYSTNLVNDLPNMITKELFESVYQWTLILNNDEPLKIAMDSMLCSICCIRPEMFPLLLQKIGVLVPNLSTDADASISDDRKDPDSMTDDSKQEDSDTAEWYSHLVIEELPRLSLTSSALRTIAMACQSPLAIQQLLDSGLPRLLISAILEFCYRISREQQLSPTNYSSDDENLLKNQGTCLTDSDKAEEHKNVYCPLVNAKMIAEILEFFSEICSEGHMRDWLGSYEGSVFWKPLLDILCNNNPFSNNADGIKFSHLEESMIKFLSKISSCHPKNQEALTVNLISVIRKPTINLSKSTISGFTRRLVLQLLLESEKILISVRSDFPLQRKENIVGYINNHPSKRPNAHHLLFYLRTHTKCQDILENCVSSYTSILPTIPSDATPEMLPNLQGSRDNNRKELLEMGVGMGLGMEFLSVAAGVTAKDKRFKDVKNHAAAKAKDLLSKIRMKLDESLSMMPVSERSHLIVPACPGVILSSDTTISQVLAILQTSGISLSTPCITLNLVQGRKSIDDACDEISFKASDYEPLSSPLQIFSSRGGLSLLAHYLPIVYSESAKLSNSNTEKEKSPAVNEWVKLEQNDEIYEDVDDTLTETSGKMSNISSVPAHSLAAFGLFLRLPAYSDVLLRDKTKAQCLLRLVLGVTGDGEGNEIYSLSLASSLPTLPFEVFRQLLDCSPLTTDDGVLLRRMVIEVGAVHLVLNCLGIFTHHSQNSQLNGPQTELPAAPLKTANGIEEQIISDDKSHVYWAKGTGFGTGSTQQSWNVEQALLRQKSEEEHVTVLLEVLSSYINPGDKIPSNMNTEEIIYREINDECIELPPIFLDLLQQSCLLSALSSYLRNDSVLDITRHIPLYRAILKLLRAIALSNQLLSLLMTEKKEDANNSIASLLQNMKTCVDTYASRLRVNKKSNIKGQTQKVTISLDDGDDEGLALLIPDIQETASIVQNATFIEPVVLIDDEDKMVIENQLNSSIEQRYLEVMKRLQFDTFEMIAETENGYRFVISHHFENNVRLAGERGHPARVKRLAQETVTLSTSLPLSYSSSVFVRCDNDRLDIMKVLITGPADTPYANGCFEFDVYFPADYPNSPMMINLETTGRHTVRFNPNLYNDGKVCLSVLNTWHGRPEEKWNAQTSSFLQVLVSIQSLILVPEPYFNEPGFERSRGTPGGTHSSREYNSNIYQACVRWAMLEQIKNPNPCFKDVIHTHFWVKRQEVCNQIESWITELSKPQYSERSGRTISYNSMVLRRQYKQLREELSKLPVPAGLEDLDSPFSSSTISSLSLTNPIIQHQISAESLDSSSNPIINLEDSENGNSSVMQIDLCDEYNPALTLNKIL